MCTCCRIYGEEKKVRGDGGYQEQAEAIHPTAPEVQAMTSGRMNTKAGEAGKAEDGNSCQNGNLKAYGKECGAGDPSPCASTR
jgi:hypothetical protein